MPAPTLLDLQISEFDASGSTETTPSMSWSAGDFVAVLGMVEDVSISLTTPGGLTNLTLSAVAGTPTTASSACRGYAWTGTASGSGSGAFSTTLSNSSKHGGLMVAIFSGSDGLGNTAIDIALGATTTQSLVRGSNNSAVVQIWGDWNAVNDTAVTWNNSGTQRLADFQSGSSTQFAGSWGDQGAAGTTSYGFTGHAGGASMIAIALEIKGTAGGAGAGGFPFRPGHPMSHMLVRRHPKISRRWERRGSILVPEYRAA
jgi:hypothetical protein